MPRPPCPDQHHHSTDPAPFSYRVIKLPVASIQGPRTQAPGPSRAQHSGITCACPHPALDIQVITASVLRLDLAEDRDRLAQTVEHLRPRLLILDPFVRLHRIDENVSGEVAPLLAFLRELQRRLAVAVVLVHHARKGAAKARAGQALRGSSEFHAWGDSNLYLRRSADDLVLTVEHRAAPSFGGLHVALKNDGEALALRVLEAPATTEAPPATSAVEKIERALADAATPLSLAALRTACHIRNKNACDALATLVAEGRVRKSAAGYLLASR
jgi:hypothetical protein